jgi:hypothetical protein
MWNAWGALLHSVQTGQAGFDAVNGKPMFDYVGPLQTRDDPREPPNAELVYRGGWLREGPATAGQGGSLVEFLLESYGRDPFKRLWRTGADSIATVSANHPRGPKPNGSTG